MGGAGCEYWARAGAALSGIQDHAVALIYNRQPNSNGSQDSLQFGTANQTVEVMRCGYAGLRAISTCSLNRRLLR